jgi:hypothetical protein
MRGTAADTSLFLPFELSTLADPNLCLSPRFSFLFPFFPVEEVGAWILTGELATRSDSPVSRLKRVGTLRSGLARKLAEPKVGVPIDEGVVASDSPEVRV